MMSRLLLYYIILSIVNGLTMTVKSGKETCIWETGKAGDQLYAAYEVTKGESKNLNVVIKDEHSKQLYSTSGKNADDFSYTFDNEIRILMCFSSEKKETLDISFRYQLGNELKPINKSKREEYVTSNDVDNLSDKMQFVASEIYALQDEQRFTREKQHNYKDDLYKLRKKMIMSCVFETVVMLVCCVLQYLQYRSMIQL